MAVVDIAQMLEKYPLSRCPGKPFSSEFETLQIDKTKAHYEDRLPKISPNGFWCSRADMINQAQPATLDPNRWAGERKRNWSNAVKTTPLVRKGECR
jgi:hypothetical protein